MAKIKIINIFYKLVFTAQVLFYPLAAAVFHEIDTTNILFCTFSERFQNRILVENGKVQKIISADEEKLSIFLEEISGQAFIYCRDPEPEETTLSVITNTGVVQDIQIAFTNCSSEVVILRESELETEPGPESEPKNRPFTENIMAVVSDILLGNIPAGYFPCQVQCQQWKPKNGIILDLVAKLDGCMGSDLYVYQIRNVTKKQCQLMECELQFFGCRWVFLEANIILPKQTILGVFSVVKNDK